jgi:nitric oxide synthase oxygenase domain/subunit
MYRNVKEISKEHQERLDVVVKSINEIGTYELEENELNFGASTAWRNASRCIGRMQWSKLKVK